MHGAQGDGPAVIELRLEAKGRKVWHGPTHRVHGDVHSKAAQAWVLDKSCQPHCANLRLWPKTRPYSAPAAPARSAASSCRSPRWISRTTAGARIAGPARGCMIYDSRPQTCRSFACQWLADPAAGEHWAPLKCKMVVQVTGGHDAAYERFVDVHVDRGGADAWRREPYAATCGGSAPIRALWCASSRAIGPSWCGRARCWKSSAPERNQRRPRRIALGRASRLALIGRNL